MNLRTFFIALGATVLTPWKSPINQRKQHLLERVFPKTLEELPGLYCHHVYGNEVFPYKIVREYDEWKDEYMGQKLYNPRRNKWWAKDVNGKTVLVCTGSLFNDPHTLFFKRC